MLTRRDFLKTTAEASALISIGAAAPAFLRQAVAASADSRSENVLVVVQLSGGNDGLNTVIPFREPAYRRGRPTLAVPESRVLKIDDDAGFHPEARGLADLLEDNRLAIVQGVGYPQPNRSHFESTDIWHTCRRKGDPRTTGWLGRYLDGAAASLGSDAAAMHLGHEKQPLALAADRIRTPSVASLDRFRLRDGGDQQLLAAVSELATTARPPGDDLLGFVQSSTTSALDASRRVDEARQGYQTPITYPNNALADKLRIVAQLIDAGLSTRVYYVQLDGFDTHSQQAPAHQTLLAQLGDSLAAFLNDVNHHGHGGRVLAMVFSEFGRRVAENASEGTDHGAAAPMFLAGAPVNAGFIGPHPSLDDLEDGDLKFHTDFRQVYAEVLDRWLETDSESVIGARFAHVGAVSVKA